MNMPPILNFDCLAYGIATPGLVSHKTKIVSPTQRIFGISTSRTLRYIPIYSEFVTLVAETKKLHIWIVYFWFCVDTPVVDYLSPYGTFVLLLLRQNNIRYSNKTAQSGPNSLNSASLLCPLSFLWDHYKQENKAVLRSDYMPDFHHALWHIFLQRDSFKSGALMFGMPFFHSFGFCARPFLPFTPVP